MCDSLKMAAGYFLLLLKSDIIFLTLNLDRNELWDKMNKVKVTSWDF